MEKKSILVPDETVFNLHKVKLVNDGGISVMYELTEIIDNEVYTNKCNIESAKDVHPDLRNLFEELKPIMCRVFGQTDFLSLVETPEFEADAQQLQACRSFASELMNLIDVRGVSISGEGAKLGVVISGVLKIKNGQKTSINTPRLLIESEVFGFEEELEGILDKIKHEVYLFLFQGKKAQLELFDATGDVLFELDGEE